MPDDAPTIIIYATYRIEAHDQGEFRDVATRMAKAARSREGCTFLNVAEEVGAPGTFRLIEGWRDQIALDRHQSSEDFQTILAEAGKLAIVERRADVYAIASRTSLDMSS
ncbi:putative quinol monooxygenase [Ponticoccus alexandrii]|uniref:Antibiotic biosynthesis monooxygenase n=1 Tax=Ponticoccus alexandrii TaxID=1943633 RepID=A0ABX7FAK2_9RHOB|nr:putative quinol monooxygenase [Ponticoccus alexandrii]QRF67578.1 antibiotic biosynthesis monooxygenase [Ponticoccus alexandrii]